MPPRTTRNRRDTGRPQTNRPKHEKQPQEKKMIKDIQTVTAAVEQTLKNNKKARNNDTYLTLLVLEQLGYAEYNYTHDHYQITIGQKELQQMPALESIRRTRQKLQQQGKYPPTQQTQQHRKQQEQKIRQKMKQK